MINEKPTLTEKLKPPPQRKSVVNYGRYTQDWKKTDDLIFLLDYFLVPFFHEIILPSLLFYLAFFHHENMDQQSINLIQGAFFGYLGNGGINTLKQNRRK